MVVDNLNLVRDINFIDQNWTTEHFVRYYAEGCHLVARQVADALKTFYPSNFIDPQTVNMEEGHYAFSETTTIHNSHPYSNGLQLSSEALQPDWERVNVAFNACRKADSDKMMLVVQWYDGKGNSDASYHRVKESQIPVGKWDFATFALPVDSVLRSSQHFKIFVYNPSDSPVQVKDLDISFRPAYMKPGVKGEKER